MQVGDDSVCRPFAVLIQYGRSLSHLSVKCFQNIVVLNISNLIEKAKQG